MQVRALGTAAGGGFPQWNCGCENCSAVRAGTFQGKARTQAQLAVSPNGNTWFLLGASPDLRGQIEVTNFLHPRNGIRQSPIAGVVLASADIDHALGLLLLRELQPLRVYTTPAVRTILLRDNSMFRMLNRVPNQVAWSELPLNAPIHVRDASGSESGLRCEAVSLGSKYPAYVGEQRITELPEGESLIGLIVSADSGKKLGYFPSVPQVSVELLARMDDLDLLFFDGTFWSDDELIRVQGSGQTARQMGHLPVGSSDGTLERLAGLRGPRKIFMHINNTNPMLNEAGPEYAKMREAGWELAEDGSEWRL